MERIFNEKVVKKMKFVSPINSKLFTRELVNNCGRNKKKKKVENVLELKT